MHIDYCVQVYIAFINDVGKSPRVALDLTVPVLVSFTWVYIIVGVEWPSTCFCHFSFGFQLKKEHPDEAIHNEVVGQAHMENYALKVFLYADNEDRAARFNK